MRLTTQTAGSPITAPSVNGVLVADYQAGGDIGQKINSAFASCGNAASCLVTLLPGQRYSYSTTINIPGTYAELDCNGSELDFEGAPDAVSVAPGYVSSTGAPYISGRITNCYIEGNGAAHVNGIHQRSRTGFIYENMRIWGFFGAGSAAIWWENVAEPSPLPSWNEQNSLSTVDFGNNTISLRMTRSSGTDSFMYNNLDDVHCDLRDGQFCISVEGTGAADSATVFGGYWNIRANVNASQNGSRIISLTGGARVERSWVNVTGEQTGGNAKSYAVYADGSSTFYAVANVQPGNILRSYTTSSDGSVVFLPPLNSNGAIHFEPSQDVIQQRHCKYDLGPINATFWLTSYGGMEDNCNFQLVGRSTDDTNRDVDVQGKGFAPVNILFADALTRSVGIGAGWSASLRPAKTLDVAGSLRVSSDLVLGTGKNAHVSTGAPNSDTAFIVPIHTGAGTATFTFTRSWANPPNCVVTPNALVKGTWYVTPSTRQLLVGLSNPQSGPVTFFAQCTGNPD